MSKHYRPWKIDEAQLLPASVQDYVPKDHPSRFIVALVREHLDLSEIEASYASPLGQPAFHPALMTALLLHGYASGIGSSRRIAKACRERADFMMIVAGDPPDFRTISDFRKRHLSALKQLFVQVLKLCEAAGLVKLGHVAFDGSKIRANASKHKAMSYGRMEARASELEAEVDKWLAAAEAADAAEDKLYGRDKRGDALPAWVADKKRRAAKIRAAKAKLEAEAKAAAEAKAKAAAEAEEKRQAEGRRKPGKPAAPPSPEPDPKAQKNFTDPESRIMKSKDGFVQSYNGQIAVDAHAQVIVAHDVTQSAVDSGQLLGMADAVEANLGRKPAEASADAGYCSEANLAGLEERKIDAYVATGRAKDAVAGAAQEEAAPADAAAATGSAQEAEVPTRVEAMRTKIKSGGHASPYRLRKQVVEPVFGQIKQARGFRQFLLRGIEKVRGEWALVCTAHNLLKLAQRWSLSAATPMPQEAMLAAA
jgi:transposase